ncbi:hypothetical protein C100_06505 [Sphingobium sp. C100]|nr:hypothetical protein C100_06505 [Sphingobium sp. C100]
MLFTPARRPPRVGFDRMRSASANDTGFDQWLD